MRESQLQRKVKKAIEEKYKSRVWFYHPKDMVMRGIPDIIMCIDGRFVAIELKVNRNKLTKIQEYNLKRIEDAGGWTFWGTTIEDVMDELFNSFS